MKQDWPLVELGTVLHQVDRSEPTTSLGVINLAGIYGHGKGLFERGPLIASTTSYKSYNRLVAGDFMISQPKAWEGAIAAVPEHFNGWYLSPVFPAFRPDERRLLLSYLHWYCQQPLVWDQLKFLSTGMGARRETVSPKQFLSLKVPLPPLEKQRAITATIDSLQMKLHEIEKIRTSIEVELQSLFLSLHNASGTKCKLGDLIELHEDAVRIQPTEAYPQVGVRGFGGGLFSKSAVIGTETTYKFFNRLYEGAVVLSQVKGWEGAIAVCPKSLSGMYVSPEYRTFRCNTSLVSPTYMQEVVRSQWFWQYLQKATRGVGARRERVRPEKFLAIELHMPSFERQKTIVAILNALERARKIRTEIQPSIDAVTPAVLQKELGQIRAEEV
jgi:type I restriction enzyme, S subunit